LIVYLLIVYLLIHLSIHIPAPVIAQVKGHMVSMPSNIEIAVSNSARGIDISVRFPNCSVKEEALICSDYVRNLSACLNKNLYNLCN
jgi:hypothetical protein